MSPRIRLVLVVAVALLGCRTSSGVDAGPLCVGSGGGAPDAGAAGPNSVLQHHNSARRDGRYLQPALTRAAAGTLHRDSSFTAATAGPTYAQPLYFENGPNGRDLIIVATERNQVSAFDAATGATVWQCVLAPPVSRSKLPCGNIDPVGITGTPVIDGVSRTLYLDAMTLDTSGSPSHKVFAVSVDDGGIRSGWPVALNGVRGNGAVFDSSVQNERGALLLLGGFLYVPFGGHFGDCGNYRGWVVGVPLANPSGVTAWATSARGGGAWGPSGLASDGASVFATTGNTFGATAWSGGESLIRFAPGPAFSGQAADYWAPSDWSSLDGSDTDVGGSGPVLLDIAGATPSSLAVALGKNGKVYLVSRASLGGVGAAVAELRSASNEIINAAAAYTTALGTYVVHYGSGTRCPAGSGDLISLKVVPGAPPTLTTAWCASANGHGSPMVTTTDGTAEAIVWSIGAEGDNRLHGFDADTGAVVFSGGGSGDQLTTVRRFQTPIAVKGRIFVATDDSVVAFAL